MTIWFGFIGLFFIVDLLGSENGGGSLFFSLGMLAFGYALTMGGYLFESFRTKEILTDITKGHIIN